MALDRLVDAFIDGRIDFESFRQTLEEQLGYHPEDAGPAITRLETLRAAGRLSSAMHALVFEEIKRGSRGDITAPIDEGEAVAAFSPDPEVPVRAKAPPVLTNTGGELAAAAVFPGVGTVLAGRYRLEALLERGGMSMVFRAGDLRLGGRGAEGAKVGVKLASPERAGRGAAQALEREASLLTRLSHPGVVRMLGFEHDGDLRFMVMELLDGERLRGRLVRSHPAPLPAAEALRITGQLAGVLAYLHARGIVHRDIKPANIFVTATGELRLIDFGLAAATGGSDEAGGERPKAWTPLYASPEMLGGGAPDPRDDVYSLGCVVYEMLTGRHPWGNVTAAEAAKRRPKLSPPADLSRRRWAVLKRAIAFRAADRPADAAAFLADFFPPGRPRRLLPWVAVAFLGGMATGLALTGGRPGVPAGDSAPALPAAVSPQAELPEVGSKSADQPALAQEFAAELPPAEESAAAEAETPVEAVVVVESPPPAEAPAVVAPAAATPPLTRAPEGPPALALAASSFRVSEGAGALRLELRRPAGHRGPLGVLWRTVDQTARDGVDYSGSTSWQWAGASPGAPSLVVFIPIVDDSRPGPDLTFRVELQEVPEGPALGTPAAAEVTIVDDD